MATAPKPGARNDLNALKDARRHAGEAVTSTERAMDELARMREGMGRPDYGKMDRLLGQLALNLAKVSKHLEEMWTLRAMARQSMEDDDMAARLADIEAQMRELMHQIGEKSL